MGTTGLQFYWVLGGCGQLRSLCQVSLRIWQGGGGCREESRAVLSPVSSQEQRAGAGALGREAMRKAHAGTSSAACSPSPGPPSPAAQAVCLAGLGSQASHKTSQLYPAPYRLAVGSPCQSCTFPTCSRELLSLTDPKIDLPLIPGRPFCHHVGGWEGNLGSLGGFGFLGQSGLGCILHMVTLG